MKDRGWNAYTRRQFLAMKNFAPQGDFPRSDHRAHGKAALEAIMKPKVSPDAEIFNALKKACQEEVKNLPAADVVEVVRCGECEWWTKQEASCQGRCNRYGIYPTSAWYCAAGTKMDKEDENNETDK